MIFIQLIKCTITKKLIQLFGRPKFTVSSSWIYFRNAQEKDGAAGARFRPSPGRQEA